MTQDLVCYADSPRVDFHTLVHWNRPHRLLKAGLSQKRSVAVLWLCTAALAFAGCAISGMSGPIRWAIFVVLAVIVLFVIWKFGLFKPVLKHHYDNFGKRGPRLPRRK